MYEAYYIGKELGYPVSHLVPQGSQRTEGCMKQIRVTLHCKIFPLVVLRFGVALHNLLPFLSVSAFRQPLNVQVHINTPCFMEPHHLREWAAP